MKFKQIHNIFLNKQFHWHLDPLEKLLTVMFTAILIPAPQAVKSGLPKDLGKSETNPIYVYFDESFKDTNVYKDEKRSFEFDGYCYKIMPKTYSNKPGEHNQSFTSSYQEYSKDADVLTPSIFIYKDPTKGDNVIIHCFGRPNMLGSTINPTLSLEKNFNTAISQIAAESVEYTKGQAKSQNEEEQTVKLENQQKEVKAQAKAFTYAILGYGAYAFIGLFFGATTMLILITYLGKQQVFDDGMQLASGAGASLEILLSIFFVIAIAVAADKCCNSDKFKNFGLNDGLASTLIFRIAMAAGLFSTTAIVVQLTVDMEQDIAQYVTFGAIGGAILLAVLATAIEALYNSKSIDKSMTQNKILN